VSRRSAGLALVLGCAAVLTNAGCGSEPDLPPAAPDASTAACTDLLSRLPDRVLDRARAEVGTEGVAAWGDPAIVLRCGLPASGPSNDPCLAVNGVDWTLSDDGDPVRFRLFGRTPGVEVTVPRAGASQPAGALAPLADAVRPLPSTRSCS
jgi:hypothetical protein